MRVAEREYLIQLLNEYYKQQERNCSFCKKKAIVAIAKNQIFLKRN